MSSRSRSEDDRYSDSRTYTPTPISEPDTGSGAGFGYLLILVGLVFIIGPLLVSSLTPVKISGASQLVLVIFGVVVLIIGSAIATFTKLWIKTAADRAFVRTGMGGAKVIVDGGTMVIPVVHRITWVLFESMKLMVRREGADALITGDNLRADVEAQFYVKVPRTDEMVLAAASSLGPRALDPQQVEAFIEQKLVSALRTVAATIPLMSLNTERQKFADDVSAHLEKDLQANGLQLETVTISRLDQTPVEAMDEGNVFNAQGLQTIAEITSRAKVERTRATTAAEQEAKALEVAKDQQVYDLDFQRSKTQADREAATKKAQAEAQRDADTFAAEQSRQTGVAKAESERGVKLAEVDRDQQVAVATAQREQASQTAQVARDRAVEVAKRDQQSAIAEAEQRRATAETAQLEAEKGRTAADQAVMTTQAEAQAAREKQVAIIGKEAETQQTFIERKMVADTAAYGVTAQANAEQEAAEKQALAKIRLAEASQKSQMLEAEGQQAVQMVPVNVSREQVGVQQLEVDVLAKKLATQDTHSKIAMELEIALAQISANERVQIATANSMGTALSGSNMQIWGDPETMTKMLRTFVTAQQATQFARGLTSGLPPAVGKLLGTGGAQLVAGIVGKLTGQTIEPEVVQAAIDEIMGEADDIPTTSPTGIPTVRRVTSEPSGAPSEE